MTFKPKFEVGKTYTSRRGRRLYEVTNLTTMKATPRTRGRHFYTVKEHTGGQTEVAKYEEIDLAERARLKPKPKGNGVFLSASQGKTFAACNRKWAFTYIDGEFSPSSDAMDFGTEVHTVLEHYLKTGIWAGAADAVACARQGENLLPSPEDKTLGIEKKFFLDVFPGEMWTRVMGFIDLVIPASGSTPLEVCDYKTTKDMRYAMSSDDLETDLQANLYALWAMREYNVDKVLTRWRYHCSRPSKAKAAVNGRPRNNGGFRAVSRIKTREEAETQFELFKVDAKKMVLHILNEDEWANDIEPNPNACGDYGGCPFRDKCKLEARTLGSLMSHYNKVAHKKKPTEKKESAPMTKTKLMQIIEDNKKGKKPQTKAAPKAEPKKPAKKETGAKPMTALEKALAKKGKKPKAAPAAEPAEDTRTLQQKQEEDGAKTINPPPVEQTELSKELVDATTEPINPKWIERFKKGHKPRGDAEKEWRAEAEAAVEEAETALASMDLEEALQMAHNAEAGGCEAPTDIDEGSCVNDQCEWDANDSESFAELWDKKGSTITTKVQGAVAAGDLVVAVPPEEEAGFVVDGEPFDTMKEEPSTEAGDVIGIAMGGFYIFVDCMPMKGNILPSKTTTLAEILRPMKDAVAAMEKIPHWNFQDFAKGARLLAACTEQSFTEEKPSGVVLVDSSTPEWRAVGDVCLEFADVVVRGV